MDVVSLDQLWSVITRVHWLVGMLWLGSAALTITLIVLMRTRWGQFHPLRKCVALSLLAHLLLVGYATTVQVVVARQAERPGRPGEDSPLKVSFVDDGSSETEQPAGDLANGGGPGAKSGRGNGNGTKPWDDFQYAPIVRPEMSDRDREAPEQVAAARPYASAANRRLPENHILDRLPEHAEDLPEPDLADAMRTIERAGSEQSTDASLKPEPREATPLAVVPNRPAPEQRSDEPASATVATGAGIPPALLDQPGSLPRMTAEADIPDSIDPSGEAMEKRATPERYTPARLVARQRSLTSAAIDPAYADSGRVPKPGDLASSNASQGNAIGGTGKGGNREGSGAPQLLGGAAGSGPVPDLYKLRTAPDRDRVARGHGGSEATEAAVQAALTWLAKNQSPEGRWDAKAHGAGRELLVMGRDRRGAGAEADTGMTGLALLAFLAAGHTHRDTAYSENVRRGLQYLLTSQTSDGNLAGNADVFAKMYCHAISTFALSEAFGMTGDERLRQPVTRAIEFTVAAQDHNTGGWRYRPGDPGDTSQSGWQLMALKSAELAGIPTPVRTRNGLIRFLRSVSSGDHGGLAAYRPGEQPTRTMTAEALVCWQFLGMPREHPAGNEAGDYLLGELPGEGRTNVYYWYYGTLAMYQLQGAHWQRWNEAMQEALVASQQKTGSLAGSWDPDPIWGGYGGRIYSTSLSALCLEVYYRFLPLYINAAPATRQADSRVNR